MLCSVSYEELKSGKITVEGKEVLVAGLSSYHKALEIAEILAGEIRGGTFHLSEPFAKLPQDQSMKPLRIREKSQ